MQRITDARRAQLAVIVALAVIATSMSNGYAAEDAAPEVVDSGWAVSTTDAKPESKLDNPTKPAPGKPPLQAKPQAEKPANTKPEKAPRVAAKPSTGLKWMPTGIAGKAKTKADSEAKTKAKPEQESDESTAKPSTTETPTNASSAKAESKPEAPTAGKAPVAENDNAPVVAESKTAELKEPALFPKVIEIEAESAPSDVGTAKRDRAPAAPEKKPATKPTPKVAAAEPRASKPKASGPKASEPQAKQAPAKPAEPQVASKPLRPLSRYQRSLRSRLRSVLSFYYRRPLNSVDHAPWEVMHNMLAYGEHSRILDGGPRGRPMTAVGFLCYNMPAQRKQMMTLTADGVIETRVAVGMQGHKGQLLAMLAQCGISEDYPMRVDGAKLTINDLIHSEQLSCYAGEELTFKLIGLMHYLEPSATWVNDQGETWNFPRLIEEERTQKIRGAACGGTHRLSGLSLAVRKRRELGQPIDGEYLEAERFVEQYVNYTYRWQNPDGSLSTEWFRGPGDEEDINRRARTTGHLLEWLLYTIPDERLTSRATVRAVSYLTGLLASNTNNPWEIGPLSHALHALVLYDQRVFQPHDASLVAAAKRTGRRSMSPENLNYKHIDSRVVASMLSKDEAELARAELERASSGLRGLFGNRRRSTHRSR